MTCWEERMAKRAAERRKAEAPSASNRSTWPVPEHLKDYSGRDVFLWYVMDGWRRILGGDPKVLFDNDFGFHVISDDIWQMQFTNLDEFPDERFPKRA